MLALWCPPPTPPMPFGLSYEVVALGILAQFALAANGAYLLLDHLLLRQLPALGQWASRTMLVSTQSGMALAGFILVDEAIVWQTLPNIAGIKWTLQDLFVSLWGPLLAFGLAISFVDYAYRRLGWGKTVLGGLGLCIGVIFIAGGFFGSDDGIFWGLISGYPGLIHPTLRKLAEKFIIKPRKDIWEVPRVVPVKK